MEKEEIHKNRVNIELLRQVEHGLGPLGLRANLQKDYPRIYKGVEIRKIIFGAFVDELRVLVGRVE